MYYSIDCCDRVTTAVEAVQNMSVNIFAASSY